MVFIIIFDINTIDNGMIYRYIRYIGIGYGDDTAFSTLCNGPHPVTGEGYAPDGRGSL